MQKSSSEGVKLTGSDEMLTDERLESEIKKDFIRFGAT